MPSNWSGPILVRSGSYLKNIEQLITKYSTRVAHNAVILLFALGILPENTPNAVVCTKATMWAMPEVASALYVTQYSDRTVQNVIERVCTQPPASALSIDFNGIFSFCLLDGNDFRSIESAHEAGPVLERCGSRQIIPTESASVRLAGAAESNGNRCPIGSG